jgi:REP element-mobilizing transposase RayT
MQTDIRVELVRGNHSVGESNYHVILCPKYRVPIFVHEIVREKIEQFIREKLEQFGVKLVAIEFGMDHVHMFWACVKSIALEMLIGQVKGYSAYMIRKSIGSLINEYLWHGGFWSGGYFYRSIGAVTNGRVVTYIEKSQDKHFLIVGKNEFVRQQQRTLGSFLDVAFRPLSTA